MRFDLRTRRRWRPGFDYFEEFYCNANLISSSAARVRVGPIGIINIPLARPFWFVFSPAIRFFLGSLRTL